MRRCRPAGPPQALEAQAVAARTFAITDERRRATATTSTPTRARRCTAAWPPRRRRPMRRWRPRAARSSPTTARPRSRTSPRARAATPRTSRTCWPGRPRSRGCAACPTPTTAPAGNPYHRWGSQMSLSAAAAALGRTGQGQAGRHHGHPARRVAADPARPRSSAPRGTSTVTGEQLQTHLRPATTYATFTTISSLDGPSADAERRRAAERSQAQRRRHRRCWRCCRWSASSSRRRAGLHGPRPGVERGAVTVRAGSHGFEPVPRLVRSTAPMASGSRSGHLSRGRPRRSTAPRSIADRGPTSPAPRGRIAAAVAGQPLRSGVMPGPLLTVDAPSCCTASFFALPDSITGADGRPSTRCSAPPTWCCGCRRPRAAGDRRVLRRRGRRLPRRVVSAPTTPIARRSPTRWRGSSSTRPSSSTRSDGVRGLGRPRGRRPARRLRAGRGRRRRDGADLDRRPRHVPVRRRSRSASCTQAGHERAREVDLAEVKRALRDPARARSRTSSRCAAIRPTACPGATGIGAKTAADLLTRHGVSTQRSPTPSKSAHGRRGAARSGRRAARVPQDRDAAADPT